MITWIADDDTAFTAFAPATAAFIADHPNVLNVARRCDCYVGGGRRSGSSGDESGWCQQPDPTGESSMTTAKPPARYGAIGGARAGGFALPSYTITWDTTSAA